MKQGVMKALEMLLEAIMLMLLEALTGTITVPMPLFQ